MDCRKLNRLGTLLFHNVNKRYLSHQVVTKLHHPISRVMKTISKVEEYDQFVPWIAKSSIITQLPPPPRFNKKFTAELQVGFNNISAAYTSVVCVSENIVKVTFIFFYFPSPMLKFDRQQQ